MIITNVNNGVSLHAASSGRQAGLLQGQTRPCPHAVSRGHWQPQRSAFRSHVRDAGTRTGDVR
ncbi:hypothetical protein [Burkholderia sp. BCC0322]|uniref:hypothetical protein n=1 Tax=unclassified Burkholderia TaxID=2613784 RepID=UPI00158F2AD4|nr:hypothetical protein [Burkholderia sp. BCC0322]